MHTNRLIVFIKNPTAGKVKTRLAEMIGEQKALKIYQHLLDHTLRVSSSADADKIVYYSDFIPANDVWKKAGFEQALQSGTDLGERMTNAFRSSFIKGYEKIILIGSDCFEIDPEHIEDAFSKLSDHDLVAGPAKDGGYYLIGMKEPNPEIFADIKWSQPDVLKITPEKASSKGLKTALTDELSDIDDFSDLMNYPVLMNLL
ncbi:MAG: TIGR04282 family arsenosugar biosynthesis glycosyltransferase [Crocinitomicaceae bacterium]|nr:TIGR04282 family arsenosugar biosynthesis glycosyltransferase [Crocinitomicaceae bacterium]